MMAPMSGSRSVDALRLIDLRIDWLAQYAPESNIFGPGTQIRGLMDLPRLEGYLGATSAAFLMLQRDSEDWLSRGDRWASLGDLITRCEAEFAGRLLIGRDDYRRWENDKEGLTWGVLGIGGFDSLIDSSEDLSKLKALFERGIRVFQPVAMPRNALTDAEGLTGLGHEFLESLNQLGNHEARPILDVAGMNQAALDVTLSWYESIVSRREHLLLVRTCGEFDENRMRRVQMLGGLVGLAASSRCFKTMNELKLGAGSGAMKQASFALASDAFGGGIALEGASTARNLIDWAVKTLGKEDAAHLVRDNARSLIAESINRQPTNG